MQSQHKVLELPEKEVSLRVANLNDAKQLAQLETTIFRSDAWSMQSIKNEIGSKNNYYIVIEDSKPEKIFGYAGIQVLATESEIHTIGLSPSYQGQGYGMILLEALLVYAASRDVSTVFLEVREDNLKAQKLYNKQGFTIIGRRENYYKNASALVMLKNLKKAHQNKNKIGSVGSEKIVEK